MYAVSNIKTSLNGDSNFTNKLKNSTQNKINIIINGIIAMPAKNNPNPAKTPIFPRFMPNSPSPVQHENSDVLVACKYCGAFLG